MWDPITFSPKESSVAGLHLELRGGVVFCSPPAFHPSFFLLPFFFTQNKRGARASRTPPLDPPKTLYLNLNLRPRIGGLNAEILNELSGQSLYLCFVFTAKSFRNSKNVIIELWNYFEKSVWEVVFVSV